MSRTLFGEVGGGGMATPLKPLMPQRLGLPGQFNQRGRQRSPIAKIGPMMSRPSGLQMYAAGGAVDMEGIMRNDALHAMPNRAVPDYLLSRMADGGDVDSFDMPMRRSIDQRRQRRIDERYRPRMEIEGEDLDMSALRAMLRPEREMSYLRGKPVSGRDRQRGALYDLYNADASKRMEEADPWWHDLAAGVLDPTSLPLMFGGSLSKIAPSIFRKFSGSMPMRGRLGEFATWGASGPNVEDVGGGPDDEQRWRFGYRDLPRDIRMIGDR